MSPPTTPKARSRLRRATCRLALPTEFVQVKHEGGRVRGVRLLAVPAGGDRPTPNPNHMPFQGGRPVLVDPPGVVAPDVHPVHPEGAQVQPEDGSFPKPTSARVPERADQVDGVADEGRG